MILLDELKYGNLIRCFGEVVSFINVTELRDESVYWATVKFFGSKPVKSIHLNPIVLTGDMLVKLGFKERRVKDVVAYSIEGLELYQYTDHNGVILFEYSEGDVKIESLHQLQNLYFALRNKQLDVYNKIS
jgi:hypothetical protein